MHRSFAFLRAAGLLAAIAVGACGKASGRSDAGDGGGSISGAGGGTSDGGPGGSTSGGGTGGAGAGGTAGVDGTGGDSASGAADAFADASGAARDGGTQTPECLAKSTFEYRVILIGAGFDLYEGRNVVAVTADSSSNTCRASGTTRIQDGAFEIELVNLAASNYPSIDAFVDLDDNGKCSNSVDAKWHVNPAWSPSSPPRTMNLTPTNFSVTGNCATSASW